MPLSNQTDEEALFENKVKAVQWTMEASSTSIDREKCEDLDDHSKREQTFFFD